MYRISEPTVHVHDGELVGDLVHGEAVCLVGIEMFVYSPGNGWSTGREMDILVFSHTPVILKVVSQEGYAIKYKVCTTYCQNP